MELLLTPSNVMFFLGLIAIIFSVYHYFKNPQEKAEKKQIIIEKDLEDKASLLAQKGVESKATLLAQQVQWEKESNEKKFVELGTRLDQSMTIAQNHIHSVDVKVDGLSSLVTTMNLNLTNGLTKLETVIKERLPNRV